MFEEVLGAFMGSDFFALRGWGCKGGGPERPKLQPGRPRHVAQTARDMWPGRPEHVARTARIGGPHSWDMSPGRPGRPGHVARTARTARTCGPDGPDMWPGHVARTARMRHESWLVQELIC